MNEETTQPESTNNLEQVVYFKVLTNLLQRPVEKSQAPQSQPFPYL